MDAQRFALLAITVIGFFGSLTIFIPKIPSNNWTWLFRKEHKEEYIVYSNKFSGKFFLLAGCVSLVALVLSFIFNFVVSPFTVLGIFVAYCLIATVLMEVKWRKHLRNLS